MSQPWQSCRSRALNICSPLQTQKRSTVTAGAPHPHRQTLQPLRLRLTQTRNPALSCHPVVTFFYYSSVLLFFSEHFCLYYYNSRLLRILWPHRRTWCWVWEQRLSRKWICKTECAVSTCMWFGKLCRHNRSSAKPSRTSKNFSSFTIQPDAVITASKECLLLSVYLLFLALLVSFDI